MQQEYAFVTEHVTSTYVPYVQWIVFYSYKNVYKPVASQKPYTNNL